MPPPNDMDRVIEALAQRLSMRPRQVMRRYELDYFSYAHELLPATASIESTTNFLVQADSGFVIVKTMGVITTDANVFVTNLTDTPKFSPFTVIWTDSGSGRDLMNVRIAWDNVIGTGQRPYYWPKPKVLDPNSTLTGRYLNLSGTDRNLRVAFGGFKVFGDLSAFKQSH